MKFFAPILAGASLPDRIVASIAAILGISLTAVLCTYLATGQLLSPLLVAPMGASAVLLFAVPASPLAQPWPIIGGNTISAIVGLLIGHLVHNQFLEVGLAVGVSIFAMSLARALHPPGGAMALGSALGGKVVSDWGLFFPIVPVAMNAIILVSLGLAFHRLGKRNYPHRPVPAPVNIHGTADAPPSVRIGFTAKDVEETLNNLHETFDIERADLEQLLRSVESRVLQRSHPDLMCSDIMSRDVVAAEIDTPPAVMQSIMLVHRLHTLPLTDGGRLVGTTGFLELATIGDVKNNLVKAFTLPANAPALSALPLMLDGTTHAVLITDERERIEGIITQSDMLATLSRIILNQAVKISL